MHKVQSPRSRRTMARVAAAAVLASLLAAPAFAGDRATDAEASGDQHANSSQALSWQISVHDDDMGNPHGTLGLKIGARTIPLREDQPVSYNPVAPGQWHVPKNASLGCLGWWAGGGEVLYVLRKPNALDVYMSPVGEGMEEPVFKLFKRIPLEAAPDRDPQ